MKVPSRSGNPDDSLAAVAGRLLRGALPHLKPTPYFEQGPRALASIRVQANGPSSGRRLPRHTRFD